MKPAPLKFYIAFGMVCFCFFILNIRAQQSPLGGVKYLRATDFSSESYFEAPDDTKIKMRLSGSQATPLPGGLLDVKNLKVETFTKAGKTEALVQAPQCTYAPLDFVASSPGRLEFQTGDGKVRVTGKGFLWRQNESSLTISNDVHTVIDIPALKPLML